MYEQAHGKWLWQVLIYQPGQTCLSIGVILYFPVQQFKGINISSMGQLDLIKLSLRTIFNKFLCCLIWPERSYWPWLLICLMCYFPSSVGQIWLSQRSYDFLGVAIPGYEGQNCQIGKIFRDNCSEKQCKKNTVQKDYTNERTSPDLNKVNYARSLKVTKAGRF
jgi:hypothetical protein